MNIKDGIKKRLLKNKFFHARYEDYNRRKSERDFDRRYAIRDTKRITKLRMMKNGKRCFIIGNGPSLRIEDLEKIRDEDSFAVNSIYKIFDKTSWRPKYYVSQDKEVVERVKGDIDKILENCDQAFLNSSVLANFDKKKLCDKLHFIFINTRDRDELSNGKNPLFSEDVTEQIFEGNTVTYACIQLAVYMGYSEIYILGVDHSYNITLNADGTITEDKSVKNYMSGMEVKLENLPMLDKATLAYRVARQVCDEKGIIIKNATRGGKLEEFERVDFDSLF